MDTPTKPADTPAALVADTYLGNLHEQPALAINNSTADSLQMLTVEINRQDCGKGRIFVQTETGQSVGIVKGRDWRLRDGDVLATQSKQRIVVRLQQQQVIALQFETNARNQAIHLIYLGHVLGNHHWPIVIQGNALYVELVADAKLVKSTIQEVVESRKIKGLVITTEARNANHFVNFEQAQSAQTHPHSHAH